MNEMLSVLSERLCDRRRCRFWTCAAWRLGYLWWRGGGGGGGGGGGSGDSMESLSR